MLTSLYVTVDLRSKFLAIHKSSSPKKRQIHAHVTCAIVSSVAGISISLCAEQHTSLQDVERMTNVIVRGTSFTHSPLRFCICILTSLPIVREVIIETNLVESTLL